MQKGSGYRRNQKGIVLCGQKCDSYKEKYFFKRALVSGIGKADIRNPLLLLAHERSRFATFQWDLRSDFGQCKFITGR